MKRSRLVIHFFLFLVAGACCLVFATRTNIPKYDGKKYSEWLSPYEAANYQWNTGRGKSEQYWESRNALLAIGTNALPWLLQELAYQRPAWKEKLETRLGGLRYPFYQWANWSWEHLVNRNSQHRWLVACDGLAALGTNASPVVPELGKLLTRSQSREMRDRAIYALRAIGEPGFLCLAAALTNATQLDRGAIAWRLGDTHGFNLGGSASAVASALVRCLDDEDGEVAYRAMEALDKLRGEPNQVIPMLTERLHDPRPYFRRTPAIALGGYREKARFAISALLDGMKDPDTRVAYWCSNSVFWIAPENLSSQRE